MYRAQPADPAVWCGTHIPTKADAAGFLKPAVPRRGGVHHGVQGIRRALYAAGVEREKGDVTCGPPCWRKIAPKKARKQTSRPVLSIVS